MRWLWDATAGTLSLDLEASSRIPYVLCSFNIADVDQVVILALARGELTLVKTYIAGKVAASCLLVCAPCSADGSQD